MDFLNFAVDNWRPSERWDHRWQALDSWRVPRGPLQTHCSPRHLSSVVATRNSSVRWQAHINEPWTVRRHPEIQSWVSTHVHTRSKNYDFSCFLFLLSDGSWKPWNSTRTSSCLVLNHWKQWAPVKSGGYSTKCWPFGNGLENSSTWNF